MAHIHSLLDDFSKLHDERIEINKKMAEKSISIILGIFEAINAKKLSFDNAHDYLGYYPTITYDGGRHPEYDANPYSSLESIFLDEKGEILIETEDAYGIVFKDLSTDDKITIVEAMKAVFENEYEQEEC